MLKTFGGRKFKLDLCKVDEDNQLGLLHSVCSYLTPAIASHNKDGKFGIIV